MEQQETLKQTSASLEQKIDQGSKRLSDKQCGYHKKNKPERDPWCVKGSRRAHSRVGNTSLHASSSLFLNTSSEGALTTSYGSLFQGPTTR